MKDPLEKASLDMGRLEKKLFLHCRQKMTRSGPGKRYGGEEQEIEERV